MKWSKCKGCKNKGLGCFWCSPEAQIRMIRAKEDFKWEKKREKKNNKKLKKYFKKLEKKEKKKEKKREKKKR